MASAMASTAARNIPPYTIPVGPRIRPPRLLPGTKAANTDPQPDEIPPVAGHVWVQGKWRNPSSHAARDRREVRSTQTEKALRHVTHGMNIYAYHHIRTNQVVYSLSRVMQNNKVLTQLLYHGKNTVPAALRRDNWRPYFSIHFSETSAGAEAGLKTYHRLRELANLRQLSPPPELTIASNEDVKKAERKHTPYRLHEMRKENNDEDIPVEGRLLPLKLRARKIMDQKASSVADAAHVLKLLNEGRSPAEQLDAANRARAKRLEKLSSRATRRLNKIRGKEMAKEAQIEARQQSTELREGQLGLTSSAAKRIVLEHGGAVVVPEGGMEYTVTGLSAAVHQGKTAIEDSPPQDTALHVSGGEKRPLDFDAEEYRTSFIETWKKQNGDAAEGPLADDIEAAVRAEQARMETQAAEPEHENATQMADSAKSKEDRNTSSRVVRILWADIRDATWAESWSSNVYHGEVESRATVKYERDLVQKGTTIDEEGNEIQGQDKKILVQGSSTPHVFGTDNYSKWYETPRQLDDKHRRWRDAKSREWQDSKLEEARKIIDKFVNLHQERDNLSKQRDQLQPDFNPLQRSRTEKTQNRTGSADNAVQNWTTREKKELKDLTARLQNKMATITKDLSSLIEIYPSLESPMENMMERRMEHAHYATVLKVRDEIGTMGGAKSSYDSEISDRLHQIDLELASQVRKYPALAQRLADKQSALDGVTEDAETRISTDIASMEMSLVSRMNENEKNISDYERRIAELEVEQASQQAPDRENGSGSVESRLSEARRGLENEEQLLATDLKDTFQRRFDAVYEAIEYYETKLDTSVTDLVAHRLQLERADDTAGLEAVDRQLREYAEEDVMAALGLQAPDQVDTVINEYNDEQTRSRGIERPPPPLKSIWARFRAWFGR